ncbi:MAG: VWA domain-containing protein [Spirochaetota bacterium]
MKRVSLLLTVLTVAVAAAPGQSVTITQIDPSGLLTRQRVDLYLSLTDDEGEPIAESGREDFRVSESADGEQFEPVPLTAFDRNATEEEGITFFLLVDNSGSMYDTLEGRPTDETSRRRITHMRSAVRDFLSSIDNPRDEVGLASFNTLYTVHTEPASESARVENALGEIERPDRARSYTELYASIREAVDDLAASRGRNVLIVLSDGENYPYHRYTGEPHPEYGEELYGYEDAVDAAQREGISVYAINFGPERDSNLGDIAGQSGGMEYDARDRDELAGVYGDIRRRVLEEYRLSYRPTTAPAERKYVKVEYRRPGTTAETTRFYYANTIFGVPSDRFTYLYLLLLLVALGGFFLIRHMRFANRRTDANLEVLGGRTQVFPLEQPRTVVGTSEAADVTVSGRSSLGRKAAGGTGGGEGTGQATVVYDSSSDSYTVEADEEIRVNNRFTKRKRLEPGDVLTIGETTVVFDDTRKSEDDASDAPSNKRSGGSGRSGGPGSGGSARSGGSGGSGGGNG